MLLAHRRNPQWFTAMCALAPALDWDAQYAGAASMVSGEMLHSMPRHHVLAEPFQLHAPLHVICGARDEVAPAQAVRRFIGASRGARCTGELVAEGDHGVAKLRPPVVVSRYQYWLRAQLDAALTQPAPSVPRSAR